MLLLFKELTYEGQRWKLANIFSLVQDSLPFVADWVRTISGLAAQSDITSFQQATLHPTAWFGRLHFMLQNRQNTHGKENIRSWYE